MILEANVDKDVHNLLEMVSKVYTFMNEEGKLDEIQSMEALYGRIARQTLECADFIAHYSETKSICESILLHHGILNVISTQGKDLTSKPMVPWRVTGVLSPVSCNNVEIKKLVALLKTSTT